VPTELAHIRLTTIEASPPLDDELDVLPVEPMGMPDPTKQPDDEEELVLLVELVVLLEALVVLLLLLDELLLPVPVQPISRLVRHISRLQPNGFNFLFIIMWLQFFGKVFAMFYRHEIMCGKFLQ